MLPRVENRRTCLVEIAPVACDDREPVVKGGCRKHEIREWVIEGTKMADRGAAGAKAC